MNPSDFQPAHPLSVGGGHKDGPAPLGRRRWSAMTEKFCFVPTRTLLQHNTVGNGYVYKPQYSILQNPSKNDFLCSLNLQFVCSVAKQHKNDCFMTFVPARPGFIENSQLSTCFVFHEQQKLNRGAFKFLASAAFALFSIVAFAADLEPLTPQFYTDQALCARIF